MNNECSMFYFLAVLIGIFVLWILCITFIYVLSILINRLRLKAIINLNVTMLIIFMKISFKKNAGFNIFSIQV